MAGCVQSSCGQVLCGLCGGEGGGVLGVVAVSCTKTLVLCSVAGCCGGEDGDARRFMFGLLCMCCAVMLRTSR